MRLKDIKGLLPEKESIDSWDIGMLGAEDRGKILGENKIISELSEKEIELDVEKMKNILTHYAVTKIKYRTPDEEIRDITQLISNKLKDILRVK